SGVWMALAYVCLLTILLIPISFWMYGRVGAVTTLYRS
ncbi:MAG: YccF domain-containing protein, partial [Actinobacteria bacterium]|nr:YccF domain-containing protein [Actinomycetota bacterium]